MVKPGPSSKLPKVEQKILETLIAEGGTGFTKLFKQLQALSEEERPGSYSTLSQCLKTLHGKNLVYYDADNRKWRPTEIAKLLKTSETSWKLIKEPLTFWTLKEPDAVLKSFISGEVEPVWSDAVKGLMEAVPDRRKLALLWAESEESFARFLWEYIEKTKPLFWDAFQLTGSLMIEVLHNFWIATQIVRLFHVGKLSQKDIDNFCENLVEDLLIPFTRETMKEGLKDFLNMLDQSMKIEWMR